MNLQTVLENIKFLEDRQAVFDELIEFLDERISGAKDFLSSDPSATINKEIIFGVRNQVCGLREEVVRELAEIQSMEVWSGQPFAPYRGA